jgi:hypothetical protein
LKTRRAGIALFALGSHLLASLVSFQATAETTAPPSISELIAVRPRAPLITRTTRPVDVDAVMAGTTLSIPYEAPARVNPLTGAHGAAAVQQTMKDSSSPQAAQRRMIGLIAGSVGLAGIGLGATTSVMALSKNPPPDRQCADPIRICSPDGKATSGSNGSLSTLSATGWAIGALGIATGAVLILTSNPKTGHQTALGPSFYSRGAGVSVRRTW